MPASNSADLLRSLITTGPQYRANLARELGISRTSVTNLANSLTELGYIESFSNNTKTQRTQLRVTEKIGVFASIVISFKEVSACITLLDGRKLDSRVKSFTHQPTAMERLETGVCLIRKLLAQNRHKYQSLKLQCCLLAVPTQCDACTGSVFPSPASRQWVGINPLQFTAKELDCEVRVQNTARLAAYTEYCAHRGKPAAVTCYVAFSYGVAMGQVINGHIMGGAHGGAGELGHTTFQTTKTKCSCGKYGCLEQFTSIPSLDRELEKLTDMPTSTLSLCHKNIKEWPKGAYEVFTQAGKEAGIAVANLLNLLDPDLLVVGGELGRLCKPFYNELKLQVHQNTLPLISSTIKITQSKVDNDLEKIAYSGALNLREDILYITQLCKDIVSSTHL